MGNFNGFDGPGLLELSHFEVLHTEPSRGTNAFENFSIKIAFLLIGNLIWFSRSLTRIN